MPFSSQPTMHMPANIKSIEYILEFNHTYHTYKLVQLDIHSTYIIINNTHIKQNKQMRKWTILNVTLSILVILSILSPTQSTEVVKKVVEIQPVALDIILPIYERVVVLFTHGINDQNTKVYEDTVQKLLHKYDQQTLNKTLFAICDISKDNSGKLKKFGSKVSLQLITSVTHYSLPLPDDLSNLAQYFDNQFPQFLDKYTASKPELIDLTSIKQSNAYNKGYTLIVSPSNSQQIQKSNKVQNKIFDYLQFFNTSFAINKNFVDKTKVEIYQNGQLYSTYAQSAVQALFNFTSDPIKAEINDLVDFINIQTIEDVTHLNDENYFRVFGSSIEYQMLFVYREKDSQNQQIGKIKQQYKQAAIRNRKQGLKYERILFAIGTNQFLKDYFADDLLQSQSQLYSIVITKTDYSSFQLRKFVFNKKPVTQNLLQFIQEVKLKKIDAQYKSEETPKDNEQRKIRKIVGNNFEKQIFEQANKSVMVLFIDSKDTTNSSTKILKALQEFVDKYYDAYKDNMNVGIFDLAKNEHKLLTIQTAPELILFERTNKKKPKFFKGKPTKQTLKNFINYEVKDVTIPENFGQPPIALGGGSTKNQQL